MSQYYDLNNTGPQVQDRLDQTQENKQDIATLEGKVTAIENEIGESGQGGNTINARLDALETAVGSGGSVDERIAAAETEIIGGASSDYNTLGKVEGELEDTYRKNETYSKTELDNLITTPNVLYVTVIATSGTTDVTTLLPATGAADTVYRVGNWDGTQYDPTMYALFAWNGTAYVCLSVRSFVGEVYDVSVNHPDGQGNPTPYADLTAALGTGGANIPADIRRGGMSIKFIQGTVQSNDNKYVQYRLIADEWSTTVTDWEKQGADFQNNIGYYVCETASSSQVKSINAPLYKLIIGSSIKIKFLHHHEAAIAYFNINSTGTTEIYYNGKSVGWGNTWKDNEIVEMFYDGTVYQCYPIVQDAIFDISKFNNGATYVNLEKALAAIPSYLRTDITVVKFIQELPTGNQYVQYTLNNPSGFTLDYTKWQGNQFILIKNTDFVNPGTLRPNGTIGVSGDVYYYAKKQIKGGSKIFVSAKTAPSICTLQFKDSNGDVISDSNVVGNYEVQSLFVTAPSNAVWVYIGNNMYGASAYSDAYYIIDFLDDVVSNGNTNPISSGGVYNSVQDYAQKKNDFVNEGCVRNTGSITNGAGTYYYAKRAIKSGDRIYAKVHTAGTICAVAFFDSNNTIISGSSIMGTYENQEINTIAPPNSVFVYISSSKPYLEDSFYIINNTNVNGITSVMSFSKRCFDFGKKSPQKPCITITFDVLKDFSFGSQKGLFDYIDLLRRYGIQSSSFFIRPTSGQIDSIADFVKAYDMGQDICIHSINTDSFGDNDTENPHPSLADAETKLQNYQKWFKNNGFPYSMGWVTSRGPLYSPYFPLLEKYLSYGHTLDNQDIKSASSVSDLYQYINSRTDDKMQIVRLGIENLQADGSADEEKIINYAIALIDKTIETNGFLCLYGHGYDNMSATYTMRDSVLTGILTYLKTKIDNFEILVGSEAEIVPYFYD